MTAPAALDPSGSALFAEIAARNVTHRQCQAGQFRPIFEQTCGLPLPSVRRNGAPTG